jgi:hypothetical protein
MSDEQNKPQDRSEETDELSDEELEQASGGASFYEALAKAWGEALDKQAQAVQETP